MYSNDGWQCRVQSVIGLVSWEHVQDLFHMRACALGALGATRGGA